MRLLPFVCCVMKAPQITTLQQSFRMTEEEEMQGYGCCFLLLNICFFPCYLCCRMLLFFTNISDDVAALLIFRHSDLADVGFYDSGSFTDSSNYHFLSFSIDIGASGQCGWMDR